MSRHELPAPPWRFTVSAFLLLLIMLVMMGQFRGAPSELGPTPATALEGLSSRPLSPIAGEIELVFGERDTELARLARVHETAADLETRLTLEREMADVKRRAILEMFRVQRRHALERGDAATVEIMDASIRRIEHRMAKGATLPPEDVPVSEATVPPGDGSAKEVKP